MTIDIAVLGDIGARIDGRPVDLGHARRQAVFVGLLADVNRLVPVDRLIDRVWGGSAPDGARASLYSYLSRLRASLSPADDAVVERRQGGYALSLSGDVAASVDLYRFRALTARARASEDGDSARELFGEALGLWRADAFGSLDTPWVNELRDSLRQERFRAVLDRNDLLLRHGGQAELLGGLLALAEEHPLDERLAGQLMLTLYREGRAAQALEHYERTRAALSRETGAAPGAGLRDLHLRILDSDPSLGRAAPVTVAGPVAVAAPVAVAGPDPTAVPLPSQLPPPPRFLAGRASELAVLDAAGSRGTRPIAVVRGLGGIGKTSLALRWAHDNLALFPDGQLYVNLHGFDPSTPATPPHAAVHDLLTALGVDQKAVPASAEARVGLYRTLLADKRLLILLDNARDAEQVRPLLPGAASCTVVITSRDRLSGLLATEDAQALTLDPLTSAEARRLLAARIGEERVAREPEAVDAIVARCGRLPLALAVTAAHAAGSPDLPLAELASELREAETTLDALDTGDLDTSLRGVFDASHRTLPEPAARLLGLLCLAPGQRVGLPAVAALAGVAPARTRALLRTLESAHLLQHPLPGRYELHDLVRLHGRERAVRDLAERDRRASLRSLVDFYVRTAAAANRLVDPHAIHSSLGEEASDEHPLAPRMADEAAAMDWLTAERAWLPAMVGFAADLDLHREAWRLSWDTHQYLRRCGQVEDFIGTGRAGLAAATRLDDPDAPTLRALAHRALASALIMAGDHGEEPLDHLTQALTRFEDTGDLLNQAHTHQFLMVFRIMAEEGEAALEHAERALELYREVGDARWEAGSLNNAGWCLAQFGRYEPAYTRCREALRASRALGFVVGEAASLDSLGYICDRAGRYSEAVEYYRQALLAHRSLRDAYEEADTLDRLAGALDALGEPDLARENRQQALTLYRAQHRTEKIAEVEARLRETR